MSYIYKEQQGMISKKKKKRGSVKKITQHGMRNSVPFM